MYWLIRPVNHHNAPASADIPELLVQVTLKATTAINYQTNILFRKYNQNSIFKVQTGGDLLKVDLMTI